MKIIWKSIILVILSTFLLYLGSDNFPVLMEQVNAEEKIPSSTIGSLEVDSLKEDEIMTLLNSKILEWKEKPIVLTGNNTNLTLLPEWFTFDVETTVNQFFNEIDKPWFAFWKSTPNVHIPLQFTTVPQLNSLIEEQGYLDVEKTLKNINEQVGMLSSEPIELVALDLSLFQSERIAFDMEPISFNSNGINEIILALNNRIINNGEVFSLLEHLEAVNLGGNNETADYIASMIYSVLLQTNFEIVERHSQGVIPPYLEPGVEAKIRKSSNEDLKFINKNNAPVTLKLSMKDSNLLFEIYSIPSEITASYQVRDRIDIKPRTIYRYSSELKPGEEELIQEGKSGLHVSVYRTISEKNGPFEKEDLMSQDYYPPINRVILKSSLLPEFPTVTDPDLQIDLNGDSLPDMEGTMPTTSNESDSINESTSEVSEELPEGSYYDKAGNIIQKGSE